MGKRVLFLANHFVTLFSFRKELISELLQEGHQVYLSIPADSRNDYFKNLGCHIISTEVDRRGINPLKDLELILNYRKILEKVKPDIVFSYTIKPNIYGSLVTNGKYRQICNITGTGATFMREGFISRICKFLYKISVKHCYKVFFQNTGDRDFFISNNMVKDNYDILPGSGCNLQEHPYVEMLGSDIVKFIFIGRIMELKGIEEYLKSAKAIKEKYKNTEFIIAGWLEEEKYKTIIEDFQKQGIVNYIGFRQDITDWIKQTHCTILPSHGGEGIPNVLLESSAMGRVCIGSNINGIREVIEDGITGYIFETNDSLDLVKKIECFLKKNDYDRKEMGLSARKKVEREFDRKIVIKAYFDEINKLV